MSMQDPIPLSLYIHLPWCIKKCPYCDFNSHKAAGELPEEAYVDALIRDLDYDLSLQPQTRPLTSIFFGGGTPSLFSSAAIARILDAVRARLALNPDCEITLEANPGATDQARFEGYRAAGVTRLSIGVQSLDNGMLKRLGRIHDRDAALQAVTAARQSGFDNFNLDMMFALPEQTLEMAAADLQALVDLCPEHISYYQLTLEPGTPFHHRPPAVPDGDIAADMHSQAIQLLQQAGYEQYEVSAWARPGRACEHNLNYWRFGDYLGIGAGAHGKLSDGESRIQRLHKQPMPRRYQQLSGIEDAVVARGELDNIDREFEFMMNALRLNDGFTVQQFAQRCFLSKTHGSAPGQALANTRLLALKTQFPDLLEYEHDRLRCTPLGRAHLDTLLTSLLPEAT